MNERIKNLVDQCYEEILGVQVFDKEKFATLIIQECANYAFSDDQERNNMLNHFGIK